MPAHREKRIYSSSLGHFGITSVGTRLSADQASIALDWALAFAERNESLLADSGRSRTSCVFLIMMSLSSVFTLEEEESGSEEEDGPETAEECTLKTKEPEKMVLLSDAEEILKEFAGG